MGSLVLAEYHFFFSLLYFEHRFGVLLLLQEHFKFFRSIVHLACLVDGSDFGVLHMDCFGCCSSITSIFLFPSGDDGDDVECADDEFHFSIVLF